MCYATPAGTPAYASGFPSKLENDGAGRRKPPEGTGTPQHPVILAEGGNPEEQRQPPWGMRHINEGGASKSRKVTAWAQEDGVLGFGSE